MSITTERQPESGLLVKALREAKGLRALDFCDLVSQQSTKYGRVNLDRCGLWRIETQGVVPLPPRRWAIAEVLGAAPGEIWTTPGSRLASMRKVAA